MTIEQVKIENMISKGNNPILGFRYLLDGLTMLKNPGLKRYVMMPLMINIIVFILVAWIGYTQFEALLNWMLPADGWLSFLRYILWPLFALATLLITFYTFTIIANIIAAPFNGVLAAKVEYELTGNHPPQSEEKWTQSVSSELQKLSYFLLRAIPLLILFVIPGINLIAPFLWILFGAWFLTLEYADYPMSNHSHPFDWQLQRMKRRKMTAFGFGGGLTLMMMVPVLNFVAMPAAVVGATRLWCEQKAALEAE